MRQTVTRHRLVGIAVGVLIGVSPILVGGQTPPAGTTVFEGARLIVGDGQPPIENAAFVVTGARIVSVGRAGDGEGAPGRHARLADRQDRDAGDRRHAHASQPDARSAHRGPAAPRLLRRQRGDEPRPGCRRPAVPDARADAAGRGAILHRRPRHHDAGARTLGRALLDHQRRRRAQGRPGARRPEGRHRQDLGRRPRRQIQEADARPVWTDHRGSAQARPAGDGAHLHAGRRERPAAGGNRRLRPRRARPRHRRRGAGAVQEASERGRRAEPARTAASRPT